MVTKRHLMPGKNQDNRSTYNYTTYDLAGLSTVSNNHKQTKSIVITKFLVIFQPNKKILL